MGSPEDSPAKAKAESGGWRLGWAELSRLPDALLTASLGLGWYARYEALHLHSSLWLGLGAGGLALGLLHVLLLLRLRSARLSTALYAWLGALLASVALQDPGPLPNRLGEVEEVMNLLLVSTVVLELGVELVGKCLRTGGGRSAGQVWASEELGLVFGVGLGCCLHPSLAAPFLASLAALAIALTGLKLGSCLSLLNLAFLLVVTEHWMFPLIHVSTNPYVIIALVARLAVPAVSDLLLSSAPRLEKWERLILASPCWHKLSILLLAALEAYFFVLHAQLIRQHKEWYVVVPFFVLLSAVWLLLHGILLYIALALSSRFARSREALGGMRTLLGLKKVLAAKGLRYFSLVAFRLMYVCVGSSLAVFTVCWSVRSPYSHSLLCAVLGLELMVTELLSELSSTLGGTCVGFGVVAPVTSLRADGLVTVLPPNFVEEAGAKSNAVLQAIVDLFSQHMVHNFGCDWSMSGVNGAELRRKLADFFALRTGEGPRFDSYLLVYSGPVASPAGGDWATSGGGSLSLEDILELWSEARPEKSHQGSRLILVVDTEAGAAWLKPVWRLKRADVAFVGLQTVRFDAKPGDGEVLAKVGEMIKQWAAFNNSAGRRGGLEEGARRGVRPCYAVSRRWSSFHFHLPDSGEVGEYWETHLPRLLHPCLGPVLGLLASTACLPSLCLHSNLLLRLRMRLWPPAELDTGHGFRLLRT